MPARSNAFQHVVLILHKQLAGNATVSESKMLRDRRSGHLREVDVVIEADSGGYPVIIGIECIDHSRKAGIEWVERMWAKHQDLPTDKLILISRAGFAKSAIEKAHALGAVPLSLNEAEQADWAQIVGRLKRIYVDIVESKLDVHAVVRADDGSEQVVAIGRQLELRDPVTGHSVSAGLLVDKIVQLPEVGRVMLEDMHDQGLDRNVFTADYRFPQRVVATDSSGVDREVVMLRITLNALRGQTPVDLTHGSLAGAHLAYGEGRLDSGRLRIAIVERRGHKPVTEVQKAHESVWLRLINSDDDS